jgi:hypothetical protein
VGVEKKFRVVDFAKEWCLVKITPVRAIVLSDAKLAHQQVTFARNNKLHSICAYQREQTHWKRKRVAPRSNAKRTSAKHENITDSILRARAGDASPAAKAPHCQIFVQYVIK